MMRLFACLYIALFLAGCGEKQDAADTGLERVTLLLNWFPEMEHGGFYAAQVHGYYAEAGLDVNIVPGGAGVQVIPRVATGQAEFGVGNGDQVIFGRAEGAPIKSVYTAMQVSPRCIMFHEETGFTTFEDVRDVTLAMNPNGAFAKFLLEKYPFPNVKVVPYAGNVAPFLIDKRMGQQGYNISEPFVAQRNGARTSVLLVADAGFNPYTSMIMTSEKLIAERPDTVRRFVEASHRGWVKYMEDATETNAAIQRLNPEMSQETLSYGVKEMQSMVRDEEGRIGTMTLERWSELLSQMEEVRLVPTGRVRPEECFTTEFLPAEEGAN